MNARDKVWPLSGLPAIIDRADCKLVLCHGCFDPLHAGHVRHLERARAMGDILVVTVTGDNYICKPGHPAVPEELRAEVVAAIHCVDFVAINHAYDAIQAIRLLTPDLYVKGADYRGRQFFIDPALGRERKETQRNGGRLVFTTDDIRLSSTKILRQLLECM